MVGKQNFRKKLALLVKLSTGHFEGVIKASWKLWSDAEWYNDITSNQDFINLPLPSSF